MDVGAGRHVAHVAIAELGVTDLALQVAVVVETVAVVVVEDVALVDLGIRGAVQSEVAVDGGVVLLGEVLVVADVGGVLDEVLGECELEILAVEAVSAEGHDAGAHAEEPVAHLDEVRLAGGVVDVDLLDGAEFVTVAVVGGGVGEVCDVAVHDVVPFGAVGWLWPRG